MYRLNLLGSVEITGPGGERPGSGVTQPKRLALLAYLLLNRQQRPVRRDHLLGLFWPESDAAHGRNALSQAIHQIRRELGSDVIAAPTAEEVMVARGRMTCDVIEFNDALARADYATALQLYQGDLLHGLFLDGLVEWEHWLDGERDRLRRAAAQAAWKLADEATDADALTHARRAYELSNGPDEAALRQLLHHYVRAGDRAGGLREYERFAEYLAAEFETAPSPETTQLAQSLRSAPDALPARRSPPPAAARTSLPVATVRATVDATPPASARRWLRVAFVPLIVVAVGAVLASVMRRDDAPSAVTPYTLAVFPFSYQGSSGTSYLSEGVPALLAMDLDHIGQLRVLDQRALAAAMSARGGAPAEIARRLGADTHITGEIIEANGRVKLSAVAQGPRLWRTSTRVSVEGTADSVFALVAQLAVRLVAEGSTLLRQESAGAPRPTTSIRALTLYLEGEEAYRSGRFSAAVDAFRAAAIEDPDFAVASYRLSRAANWTGQSGLTAQAADAALAAQDRLSPRMRQHVQAWKLWLQSEPLRAREIYRELVAADSTDIDALEQLAEIGFHWASVFGPATQTRPLWERILTLEPHNAGVLVHLARIHAAEKDRAAFDARAPAFATIAPGTDRAVEVQLLRAFAFGTHEDRVRVASALDGLSSDVRFPAFQSVAAATDHLADVRELLMPRLFGMSFVSREAGRVMYGAQLEFVRGRLDRAIAIIDSVASIDRAHALEFKAALMAVPFVDEPALERRLLVELEAPAGSGIPHHNQELDRIYLRGVLHAQARDTVAARAIVRQLMSYRDDLSARARRFAGIVEAEIQRVAGNPSAALAALGEPALPTDGRLPYIWSYMFAHERFLRAELLRELGRGEEALSWYATFPDPSASDLMYVPAARQRIRELKR